MTVELNRPGLAYAHALISAGKIDKETSWSFTGEDGNALLGAGGDNWAAYGRAHLGVDPEASDGTKAHWKYPVSKDGKLFRSGLIAARQRAGQEGAGAIGEAAGALIKLIDGEDKKSLRAAGEIERRFVAFDELVIEAREGKPALMRGHAAVFGQLSEDLGGFREQIMPGAFADAIDTDDVRALFNHDPNFVLGRNRSKTLRMKEDARGLAIECDMPDTQTIRDLVQAPIARGDVSHMSFGFTVKPGGQDWAKDDDGNVVRTLKRVRLHDVSAVTFPAYPQTDVGVRELRAFTESLAPAALTTPFNRLRAAAINAGL